MKIWLFHQYALPPSQSGITRHYQLLLELKKHGHAPLLIAGDVHHRSNLSTRLPRNETSRLDTSHPVPLLRLRVFSPTARAVSRIANMIFFAFRILQRTGVKDMEKPDVIIGCTPDLFSALASLWTARRLKVPFVFHVGEIWPLMMVEVGNIPKWHPFILLMGAFEKYLYRASDAIIVAQEKACEHIEQRGGDKAKVFYIPNGVDLDVLPHVPAPVQKSAKLKVMYIGAMGFANGVEEVIDCAALVDPAEAEFFLMGDGHLRAKLEEKTVAAGLKHVKFVPPVAKSDVYAHIADADAFIVNIPAKKPYSYGIAHNKIFDYMAMARPTIIATNTQDNPITEYDAGILVPSNDAKGMSEAVKRLVSMPLREREAMGLCGRKGIEEKYNFSILGMQLERILTDTIVRHKS